LIHPINTTVARLQAELQAAEFNHQETLVRAPTDGMVLQLCCILCVTMTIVNRSSDLPLDALL
jgi:hypothetical protein